MTQIVEITAPELTPLVEISPSQSVVEIVAPAQTPLVEIVAPATYPIVEITPQHQVIEVFSPGSAASWTLKTTITVSNSAPPSPNIGDLWIDTN